MLKKTALFLHGGFPNAQLSQLDLVSSVNRTSNVVDAIVIESTTFTSFMKSRKQRPLELPLVDPPVRKKNLLQGCVIMNY